MAEFAILARFYKHFERPYSGLVGLMWPSLQIHRFSLFRKTRFLRQLSSNINDFENHMLKQGELK